MVDVAQRAGVGTITVSRALSHPELVRPETRERIEAAIREIGFVPNRVAGSLSSGRSNIVAVIVPTFVNSVFAELFHGLSEELQPSGFQLFLSYNDFLPEREEALVRELLGWRPAGVMLVGRTHTEETLRLLGEAGIPVVELMHYDPEPFDMCVGFCGHAASYAMTRYLAEQGYRRVGFVYLPTRHNERAVARLGGYRDAVRDLGLDADPALIELTGHSMGEGGRALATLMTRRPDLQAVFFGSDVLALGALFEARRQDWAVPERIAVASFNDQEVAALCVPPLTSVRTPNREIGRRAAALLVSRLEGRETGPLAVNVGFRIMPRDSA